MSTPRFHRLRVSDLRAETSDSVSVGFEVPDALRDAYSFTQGQFLTLRADVDGDDLRRAYSICCPVSSYQRDGRLRVGIRRVADGRFSNWANTHLKVGAMLDVMTPDGRFNIALDPARNRHYLAIAGGSGITPLLSLIETTLETETGSRFTLIYGNRDTGSIMFLEQIEALKNTYLTRFNRAHVLSEEAQEIEALSGLLDQSRCAALIDALKPDGAFDHAFVCGPAPMMDSAQAALLAAGMNSAQISIERFGTPANPATPTTTAAPSSDPAGRPSAAVTIMIDGKARTLQLAHDGPTILDAGLASGANLPFSCKSGVCCTCRARVLDGEVRMDRNYTLEAWEIERGFVLSCQSHPVSEQVTISYDER